MKIKVVSSAWLERGGRRLDSQPHLRGGLEARLRLDALEVAKDRLQDLTVGGSAGIYHAGRKARTWVVDPQLGVPFVSSSRVMAADYSSLPLLSARQVEANPAFRIRPTWTLITRSGTIGRMVYARPDMDGMACSEHLMRVVPDAARVPAGYLYAFLRSRFGVPMVVSGTYGSIIQSIEPRHLIDLPVPRLGPQLEARVHALVEQSAEFLAGYQSAIVEATRVLFEGLGLTDVRPEQWHGRGRDLGFAADFPRVESFRAANYNPRFESLCAGIRGGPWQPLAEVCVPGSLRRGGRFKRVDADPDHAYRLVGQKQLFWLRPEGRWIAKWAVGEDVLVEPGTTLVAAQGTLGESELFCRAEFAWGPALELAYSEHLLRVVADEQVMLRGALFAFLRSETAFRMLRSIAVGTKLQGHHYAALPKLPIPIPARAVQREVHEIVTHAYEARHRAVALEREAVAKVEDAIEALSRPGSA